jgi:hypothetical protein
MQDQKQNQKPKMDNPIHIWLGGCCFTRSPGPAKEKHKKVGKTKSKDKRD